MLMIMFSCMRGNAKETCDKRLLQRSDMTVWQIDEWIYDKYQSYPYICLSYITGKTEHEMKLFGVIFLLLHSAPGVFGTHVDIAVFYTECM